MRLLLFSDLHTDVDAARALLMRASEADVLVGAGDFADYRLDLSACVDVFRESGKPAVFVAGNHESTEELTAACRGWADGHVLHGTTATVGGVTFFGLGGAVPVIPFADWSFHLTEEEAAELLAPLPAGCVLVSHTPPHGVVDRSSAGRRLGSVAVREAVLRARPVLTVCGHIHGSAGRQERLGETPVVNAGPAGLDWTLP